MGLSMQDGGFLCFSEMTGPMAACLWGLDSSFWTTADSRAYGSFASVEQWHGLLKEVGQGVWGAIHPTYTLNTEEYETGSRLIDSRYNLKASLQAYGDKE